MWQWDIDSSSQYLNMMKTQSSAYCPANCSGHGECLDGVCFCQLEYQGHECDAYNNAYFTAFGLIFYLLSLCCTIQLILCIQSDFRRLKNRSFCRALRVTTQKLLYFLVIIAALSRAIYFSLQQHLPEIWASNILSMYYPLLLSCLSLVVCFWAEAFHLSGKQYTNPGFLSDSFLYFIIFNILLYILLLAEFITMETASLDHHILSNIFNGVFAGLMIIEVIFFLVYGVEVFFKIKGAFTAVDNSSTGQSSHPSCSNNGQSSDQIRHQTGPQSTGHYSNQPNGQSIDVVQPVTGQSVDVSIMHQSRIGMLCQGILQIVMVLFLMLNITEPQWRESLPVFKRNVHDVLLRVVEVGLALWFPCVLWKCRSPETLWMLNPTRLLKRTQDEEKSQGTKKEDEWLCRKRTATYDSTADSSKVEKEVECWICYDSQRSDAGAMIQPCDCKGDVAYVHHDCLKRWLMESADNPEALHCKVCQSEYQLKTGFTCILSGFQLKHVIFTTAAISLIATGPAAVYLIVQRYPSNTACVGAIGVCILLEIICFKYLGISLCTAYNRARISSLHIIGKNINNIQETMATGITNPQVTFSSNSEKTSESSSVAIATTSRNHPSVSVISVVAAEISSDAIQVHCGQ